MAETQDGKSWDLELPQREMLLAVQGILLRLLSKEWTLLGLRNYVLLSLFCYLSLAYPN